jgi:hypothetical protein
VDLLNDNTKLNSQIDGLNNTYEKEMGILNKNLETQKTEITKNYNDIIKNNDSLEQSYKLVDEKTTDILGNISKLDESFSTKI